MSYTVFKGKLVKVHRNSRTGVTNVNILVREEASAKAKATLKGKQDGNCNVTACQKPGATWWNTSTRAYYCLSCARDINYWSRRDEGYDICYPSEAAARAAEAVFTPEYYENQPKVSQ